MNSDSNDDLTKALIKNQFTFFVLFLVWGILGVMLFVGTVYYGWTWNYDVLVIAKDYFTYSLEIAPAVPEDVSIILMGIAASSIMVGFSMGGIIVYLMVYHKTRKDIEKHAGPRL